MKIEIIGHPEGVVGEEVSFLTLVEGVQFHFVGEIISPFQGEQIAVPVYREGSLEFSEEKGRYIASRFINAYSVYELRTVLVRVPKCIEGSGIINISIGFKSLGNVDTCPATMVADESRFQAVCDRFVNLPDSLQLSTSSYSVRRKDRMTAVTPKGVVVDLPTGQYCDDDCLIVAVKNPEYSGSFNYIQTVWTATRKG